MISARTSTRAWLLAGALALGAAPAAAKDTAPDEPGIPRPKPVTGSTAQADPAATVAARAVDGDMAGLIRRLLPAYIFVGGGSGVIISPDGYALTNHHVAGTAKVWKVRTAAGKVYVADVAGTDPVGDILLLKLRNAQDVPHLELGNSDAVQVGQTVVAIGNPFGLGVVDEAPTVTVGVVSATHRYHGNYSDAIQTDAPVNPGNSGGPLMTLDGKVVGINGQIATRFGTRSNTGIGYAIPANQIRRFLPLLKEAKGGRVRHGTIRGLQLRPFVPDAAVGEDRAVVQAVRAGSTAETAGFKPGDEILAAGGEAIVNYARFAGVLGTWPAGSELEVVVRRDGAEKKLGVRLDVLPVAEPVDFGWTLEPANPEGLRRNQGLKVKEVRKDGPAEKAGIRAGDVLLELAEIELGSPFGVLNLLRTGFEGGQPVKGRLRRIIPEAGGEAGKEKTEDSAFEIVPAALKTEPRADWGMSLNNAPEPGGGFRVTMVRAGGAAEKAGIRFDDVIVEMNGRELKDLLPLQELFRDTKPGQTIKGKLRRKDEGGAGGEAKEVEFSLRVQAAQM
ncbi:MAG TPA: PDZ domain-containing protein [Planctomycetota bacterium]|nr:PDZ domain-containing protein [Planctomycetota bacterium]